jgi:hypothetical protein
MVSDAESLHGGILRFHGAKSLRADSAETLQSPRGGRYALVSAALAALGSLLLPHASWACKCAQRPLAEYYAAADEVVIGRLVRAESDTTVRTLEVELLDDPYKGPAGSAGEQRRYATELETATCGVPPEPDAIYLLFGQSREDDARSWVDTCSGSRIQISRSLEEPAGFDDVPARFVAQQLNALAGMDVMRDVAANAPSPSDGANDVLIGLLRIPALDSGGDVPLYAAPELSAAPLARIASFASLASREYAYEQAAAVVVADLGEWYRVPLAPDADFETIAASAGEAGGALASAEGTKYVWLRAADGELLRYPELVVGRLAYLNEYWSGFIWPSPGAGIPFRRPRAGDEARREQSVNVLEATEIGGMPFVRIEIVQGVCEGPAPRVLEGGWVPAYGPSGEPTAWFHSRGC